MTYQKHIDGLRAIAIVWVVAFHFFPGVFPGGFIGVDVFFVISGYLISGIIWHEIDGHRFSFVQFYLRRVRRIFPALLTVLIVVLWMGVHLLHDGEWMQLLKHTFAASLFLNNWVLSIEKGYFDIGSEYKPLLHLWSLSIEEQFYLLWPLLLVLIHRCFTKSVIRKSIVTAVCLGSFLACLIQTFTHPVGAFYSPHTRVWELIAGAMLHLIPLSYRQQLGRASALGMPLLLTALVGFHAQLPFPGYWALLPVIGALLLLVSPARSWTNRFLSAKPMMWIGLISYPLYLWHWPLMSFGLLYWGDNLNTYGRLVLLIVAVVFSLLTKKLIEDPMRHGAHPRQKALSLLAIMVVLSLLSVWIHRHDGFTTRSFNQHNLSLSTGDLPSIKHLIEKSCPYTPSSLECWRTTNSESTQAVIGDSKGKAFFVGLLHHTQGTQGWFYLGGNAKDGAPIPQPMRGESPHQGVFEQAVHVLNGMPEVKRVVLAVALRSLYRLKSDDSVLDLAEVSQQEQTEIRAAVHQALKKLAMHNREVWILMDNPTFLNPPRCVSRNIGWPTLDALRPLPEEGCGMALKTHLDRTRIYREMILGVQRDLASMGIEIAVLDSTPVLCDPVTSRCEMTLNGRYLYDFTDHMSAYGSARVAEHFVGRLPKSTQP